MDAALVIAVIAGLAVGGLIAWLYASRESAAAKQTVESLRLQLDAVSGSATTRGANATSPRGSWRRCRPTRAISTSG